MQVLYVSDQFNRMMARTPLARVIVTLESDSDHQNPRIAAPPGTPESQRQLEWQALAAADTTPFRRPWNPRLPGRRSHFGKPSLGPSPAGVDEGSF